MVSHIIFDLFGTLVPPCPTALLRHSLFEMAPVLGLEEKIFSRIWIEEAWHKLIAGEYPSIELALRSICSNFNVTPSVEQIQKAVWLRHAFTRQLLLPYSDSLRTLKELKGKGIILALISNSAPDVVQLWPETPLVKFMDVAVFSCEIGITKPNPQIYIETCNKLNVKPPVCAYIGDGSNFELSGAVAVGMRAILFDNYDKNEYLDKDNEASIWCGERIGKLSDIISLIPKFF